MDYLKQCIFFIGIWGFCNAFGQTLPQDIDDLIHQSLPNATVGVFVQDLESGKIIYQRHANKLLKPASNIKLLTAAAALYHFGANHRYTTRLFQQDDNFYFVFSGSPSLTTTDLNQLLLQLKSSVVNSIRGDIILDASQFKAPFYAAGSSYDDLGWYYDAPSTAIILNGNAANYDVISGEQMGMLVYIKAQAHDSPIAVMNDVMTVSKKDAKEHCLFNVEVQSNNTLHLYGCLSQQKATRHWRFAIPNPCLYVTQKIKAFLEEHHIVLEGKVRDGIKPPQAKLIASHQSAKLGQLVGYMLKESDNLYADSLTKRLGFFITREGTYQQGVYAIKQILAQHTHLNLKLLKLSDGHGTRYNMMTPKQMVVFLTDIYQDQSINAVFMKALPCFGVSGTLKDRMKDGILMNKVCAKTGSMHDISALSGYMMSDSGKMLAFSIMMNNLNTSNLRAKELEEKILLTIFLNKSLTAS